MTSNSKRLQTIYESKTEIVTSYYNCPRGCGVLLQEKITTYSNDKTSSKLVCRKCNRGFKIKEVIP